MQKGESQSKQARFKRESMRSAGERGLLSLSLLGLWPVELELQHTNWEEEEQDSWYR